MIESNGKKYDSMEEMFNEWDSQRNWLENFIDNKFSDGIADYRASYSLSHPWKILEYIFDEIKYAYQRIFKGYDERIVWSIDFYLAKMIPLWVRDLEKTKHGVPMDMFDSNNLKESHNPDNDEMEIAQEKFNNILEQIAIGFECYEEFHNAISSSKEYKELELKFNNGFELFKKHFSSLWD